MSRKVMISFLGTNKYKDCCYVQGDFDSGAVRYVQEALYRQYHAWAPTDCFYIFITDEARKRNWEGDIYDDKTGLKHVVERLSGGAEIRPEMGVPPGTSEGQLWAIFEMVFSKLEDGDEVYLDVTHSFRSLPMLQIVLLNYARVVKKIEVISITYGAFEVLGDPQKIEENIPDPEDRKAPLLDLSSFVLLQDWTKAASDFTNYGQIDGIFNLTKSHISPILKETRGKDQIANNLSRINSQISTLVSLLRTNRGKRLSDFDYNNLLNSLDEFRTLPNLIQPIGPVVEIIREKVESLAEKEELIWLKASKWAYDHDLIQQSITQLQEGFLSWVCSVLREETGNEIFNPHKVTPRNLISQAFKIFNDNIPFEKWLKESNEQREIAEYLQCHSLIQDSADLMKRISNTRNDISHGGYTSNSNPNTFSDSARAFIDDIEAIVNQYASKPL